MLLSTSPPPTTGQPLRPVLKWPGGKRQVLPSIRPLLPTNYNRYFEPFLGGGAVLFDLRPQCAVANDLNSELVNMYQVVRDYPESLIGLLGSWPVSETHFLAVRAWDRQPAFLTMHGPVERAARTVYLNRLCFNGLYRVNRSGQFNVSWGKYSNPTVCDGDNIRAMSDYLSGSRVCFYNEDFRRTIGRAGDGDFIYADPPYAPLDDAASTFTSYTSDGFSHRDLADLKDALDQAAQRGATWLMSNVKSQATTQLFPKADYQIREVAVTRPINSKGAGRRAVPELLVQAKTASASSVPLQLALFGE